MVFMPEEREDAVTADEIIALLALTPHPEGGHYRQSWVETPAEGRPAGTCIYFLLKAGERSHWHRVDTTEIWHYYAGAPLVLRLCPDESGPVSEAVLGPDLATGARPQRIVPKDWWQAAESTGDWTLVGCTVSPGFRFEGFELAPIGVDFPL